MSRKLVRLRISIFTLVLFAGTGIAAAETHRDPPTQWITHASTPGPDYAAVGHSLFDELFRINQKESKKYKIPYPFDALIENLRNRIENDGKTSVPHILIPIGRSLQREAAAPNYFQFPRSIITLIGEPLSDRGQAASVMKHRLFIAYQEKANLLEVISYNEAAGRFEFQLVENYRSNARPHVTQANRTLCMSSHQNGAPIFAATPWSESNLNPDVAIKIARAQPAKYRSLIAALSDDAGAIDLAINSANYLAAARIIWQSGCDGSDMLKNLRCRAAILLALLQFRLSDNVAFDMKSPGYQADYLTSLDENWRHHWPGGLSLVSARIPDINPFKPASSNADHDPLYPRPAQAFWPVPSEALSRGVIYRIAEFLTEADILRLDQHLLKQAGSRDIKSSLYRSDCSLNSDSNSETSSEFIFDCSNSSSIQSINATIGIEFNNRQVVALRVLKLSLRGNALIWQPSVANFTISSTSRSNRLKAKLSGSSGKLSARLENGNRFDELSLSWPQNNSDGEPPESLALELIISHDFKILRQAIEKMVAEGLGGESEILSSLPFSQRAIIGDLEKQLGMKTLGWCCEFETTDQKIGALKSANTLLQGDTGLFYRYCASCHSGNTDLPPGFLHGSPQQVASQLRQCAPRILRRLTASRSSADSPVISPMPPLTSITNYQIDYTDWQSSTAYQQLTTFIKNLLRSEDEADLTRIINSDYQNLQPCSGSR